MNKILSSLLVVLMASCLMAPAQFKPANRWDTYYQRKLADPPREFVKKGIEALPKANSNQVALDLGAGVGHETLLLLKHGFHVIAVDYQPQALDVLVARPDMQKYRNHLETVAGSFENLNYRQLPAADVVVAAFALPFCPPNHFDRVWSQIRHKIKPGGVFIGNFFDPGFTTFSHATDTMTFHNAKATKALFDEGFTITHFKEIKIKTKRGGYDHHYQVIAKKNA